MARDAVTAHEAVNLNTISLNHIEPQSDSDFEVNDQNNHAVFPSEAHLSSFQVANPTTGAVIIELLEGTTLVDSKTATSLSAKDATGNISFDSKKPGMDDHPFKYYQDLSLENTFNLLGSNNKGITQSEANERERMYGLNKLPEFKQNSILQFLKFMWNPLSWAMEVACVISIVFLDYLDFILILVLLLLNSAIGFYEERKAQRAIRELMNKLEPKTRVYRDNELVTLGAQSLVPGDLIALKFGDMIPADVKIIDLDETILVDQASMTGESLPSKKNKGDFCFGGTGVKQGECKAIVCRTGVKTEQNRSFASLSSEVHVGNLTKVMNHIGIVCLSTIVVWAIIEIIVQFVYYGHTCKLGINKCPTMINTLVIIIGGIPIAMPTVLSITLALGGSMMAKQGAIVTRLTAIEEIAGMDILCSDKTGTLTLNRLSVNKSGIYPGWKYLKDFLTSDKKPIHVIPTNPNSHTEIQDNQNKDPNISNEVDLYPTKMIPHDDTAMFSVEEVLYYGAVSAKIENEEPIDMCLHNSYVDNIRLAENERTRVSMAHYAGSNKDFSTGNNDSTSNNSDDDKLEANNRLRKKIASTLWSDIECRRYIPFNPTSKKTIAYIYDPTGCTRAKFTTSNSTPNDKTARYFRVSKGAPQVILKECYNFETIRQSVDEKVLDYANHGYRCVGIGLCEGWGDAIIDNMSQDQQSAQKQQASESKWVLVGLVPLMDPPRHDTKDTINKCLDMGIGVKMITGDQLPIGIETARLLGMGTNFHTPEVFELDNASGLVANTIHLDDLIYNADGFAEVFPEHKYLVVKKLQEQGHIVGMTGDGVNDAPALKKADIGIAVADATDAARAAADFVLTQEGLSVIIAAVTESRKIFQRMKSYAQYTIASTIRTCFTFGLLTVVYNWYFPATLVVILAVLNDGAMISLSRDRAKASPVPEAWFLRRMFTAGFVYGLYLTFSSWLFFYVASQLNWFSNTFSLKDVNFGDLDSIRDTCSKVYNLTALSEAWSLCIAQQTWVRASYLRAIFYLELSISSQSLIFVTRTRGFSFLDRPGVYLMIAFVAAQVIASFICAYGLNGFEYPSDPVECVYCDGWNGGKGGPSLGSDYSESIYSASVLPAGWKWVLVCWIWAIVWYIPLDLLKITMEYLWDSNNKNFVRSLFPDSLRETANSRVRPSADIEAARRSTGRAPRASQVVRASIY